LFIKMDDKNNHPTSFGFNGCSIVVHRIWYTPRKTKTTYAIG
jgi:hypothetical protein